VIGGYLVRRTGSELEWFEQTQIAGAAERHVLVGLGGWGSRRKLGRFCNGPDEVKSPYDCHVAELTLL
jgi:hypothetical protein